MWIMMFVSSITIHAQNITVHGTVLSKTDGEPLIGATVVPVSNPAAGVATDLDGNFELTVSENSFITVSYVGYQTQN